jgi:hypothetical protein
MSVKEFEDADLFTVRLIKHLVTNPENSWVNSYEFRANAAGFAGAFAALGEALVTFESTIHTSSVRFDRYTVSTWAPDSVPYDPEAFLSVPLSRIGLIETPETELEPLGMAYRVNRVPVTGRFGNLFYRGCLTEDQVTSPAGIPIIADPVIQNSNLQEAITDSLLDQYLGPAAEGDFTMVMIDFTGVQIRVVNALIAGGVSLIKQDHQWFNRTTAGPPGLVKKTAR